MIGRVNELYPHPTTGGLFEARVTVGSVENPREMRDVVYRDTDREACEQWIERVKSGATIPVKNPDVWRRAEADFKAKRLPPAAVAQEKVTTIKADVLNAPLETPKKPAKKAAKKAAKATPKKQVPAKSAATTTAKKTAVKKATKRGALPGQGAVPPEKRAAIREWAKTAGVTVPQRGRIPAEVVEQFDAAHSGVGLFREP